MDYPITQPSNHPITIDIFLSVIDNYGDIGFCLELIMAWRRIYGDDVEFVIWTDDVEFVHDFIARSAPNIIHTRVDILADFGRYKRSKLAFSLFHAPIPEEQYFLPGSLVLRIDYLSFDTVWNTAHLSEHIDSTLGHRIREIIPSPVGAGGCIPAYESLYSRISLATLFGLDVDKEWVLVFAYQQTLEDIIHFDSIDNDRQVIIFGYPGVSVQNLIYIPWVSIDIWHAFLDQCSWALLRGEVSAMGGLVRGKLGFWDMYKEIGGFHKNQSDDFLRYMDPSDAYRDIHLRLNGQIFGGVYFSELDEHMTSKVCLYHKKQFRINNLITEMKKCIDSHEFSI